MLDRNSRIAVASRSFSQHPVLRRELCEAFDDVVLNEVGVSLAGEALVEFLAEAEGAIIALERVDGALLDQLPKFRVISKYGVGLDSIDVAEVESRGIRLGWTPGVNALSVAELTVANMIDLLHRVPEATALVRAGGWRQIRGSQLSGKTVGIIGCGHVGKEVVRLLTPFRCKILVHDIVDYAAFYEEHGVEAVSLGELLEISDVVSLHVPLDESTRGMIGEDELTLMKPTAILINNARGGLVDEDIVRERLAEGKLAGAAFDVLEIEPPVSLPFADAGENIMVTPHIGGSTEEAVLAMGRAAIRGLME